MSLATNLTSVTMGRHDEVALSIPMGYGMTTTQFCHMLEEVLEYMQNDTLRSDMPALDAMFKKEPYATFLKLVWRYVLYCGLFRSIHLMPMLASYPRLVQYPPVTSTWWPVSVRTGRDGLMDTPLTEV